jgi:ADP-ribose pyrophosphatase YjhB (NUDIX family)
MDVKDNQGLYKNHPKIPVAVDCVIFGYEEDTLKLLLYPRQFEPSKGEWSLMGGFVHDDESMEDTVKRVLKRTVGLEKIYVEQVGAYSDPKRDPGGRVISMAYFALIRIDEHDQELAAEKGGSWWSVASMPDLIFDHGQMVKDALIRLQRKASYELIGKELLPKTFTLTQLNSLYNAIFQKQFNAGNFRKKLSTLNVLEKLKTKDRQGSKRGAFLYRFKNIKPSIPYERIVKL